MRFPFALLGLTSQVPLQSPEPSVQNAFQFKEGPDVFTPKDLIELGRPGTGLATNLGDLALVPYSKYSFEEKKNQKTIFIVPLMRYAQIPDTPPFELPLDKVGEVFWLDSQTIAHVVEGENKTLDLYSIDIEYRSPVQGSAGILNAKPPVFVGSLPTTSATNFQYRENPYPAESYLVFSDAVYADGNLSSVKEHDEAWENRGTSAFVYDYTYERHWDHWMGPKTQSLFSVKLNLDYQDGKWKFGSEFVNLLAGTDHSSPVEPYADSSDFYVSNKSVIYTTLDSSLKKEKAWHTRQNVYVVDVTGGNRQQLTSGTQGATHSPVLNAKGDKAAWLELDKDGYEADRAKIVIYDLKKNVRFTLTQKYDRSPDSLAFSKGGEFIYFTAGDHGRGKVYVLPIPPTPSESTTDPELADMYLNPVVLVEDGASSGLQSTELGTIVISKSSFTSPNELFVVSGLTELEREITANGVAKFNGKVEQFTNFTAADLAGKDLSKGEEFWFKGADDIDVQGWILKPKGWKEGQKKAHPIVLLIHGGPQSAWEDQWSTRWNPNVFAQQGYFTVAINPTGSTTFGQAFTDAIAGDWGGKPFVDLQKGWQFVLENYPEVDPDRAVAAGASWGGYAINWIQGHPEYNFGFKALFCHDGVFDSKYNGFSTDELFFFNHDWHGRPWDKEAQEILQKFNPSNFVEKWSTPQLLVHGSKDFRLPETEGIGAFHALQQLGVPSRLVIFPDENHWVMNHGNSLKWHYEVFRWFDQFVDKKD